jgi:Xaa-Pro dipeptidase
VADSSTVAGLPVPDNPDLGRMNRDRVARLQAEMERNGVDGLLLLGTGNVSYATGALAPAGDSSRSLIARPVALVVRGVEAVQLYTPYPEGANAGSVHAPVFPELEDGAAALAAEIADHLPAGARLACDDLTHALRSHLEDWEVVSASPVLGAAKLGKTVDELACIRRAQSINEGAMRDVLPLLRPGVRQPDLTARFLRRIHELGATSNGIDPIWQPMPTSLSAGPWTTHGGVAFPTGSSDRFLREGDVVWVDTGIGWHGYASDFGRTWIVSEDPHPTARQRAQFERWSDVMAATLERVKPGASALELTRAAVDANGGTRPWIEHFYLAHGVGTESAEMPLIGTDLGDGFDERLVLAPGMVLVLEPVIWDDGAAGYRSEDIFAVTDGGWMPLSDFPFHPYTAS